MADNKYPNDSFSVDDILNEVRAMKTKSEQKVKDAPKPSVITAQEINDAKVKGAAAATESSQNADDNAVKPHRPSAITPDEIVGGFEPTPIGVNQKRKPKIMTAQEVKNIKIDNETVAVQTVNVVPKPVDDDVTKAEDDKLKAFLSKTTESTYVGDSDAARQQIDALFGDDPDAVIAPLEKNRRRNTNVLSPEEIKKSAATAKIIKPANEFARSEEQFGDGVETKAERKARIKSERELEKIRKAEEKAAKVVEKHLSRSKARVEDDDDSSTSRMADAQAQADNNIAKDKPKAESQRKKRENRHNTPPENSVNTIPVVNDNSSPKAAVNIADIPTQPIARADEHSAVEFERRNFRAIRAGKIEFDSTPENEQVKDDVIDDYCTIDDAESVRFALDTKISSLSNKSAFTFVMFILLGIFTLLPCVGVELPAMISPEKNVIAYLSITLVMYVITMIINGKTIINGLFALLKLKPDIDTAVSLSVIASLAQLVFALYAPQSFADGKGFLFSAVAAAALFFNLRGKKCMFTRVRSNFDLVATTGVKQSCFALKSRKNIIITDKAANAGTVVACSRPVLNLHDYLYNSFCEDPADRMNMILAPIGLIAALVTGGLSYYITKDIIQAIGAVAVVTAIFVPLTSVLAANKPLKTAGKRVKDLGGILSGYNAVEDFSDTEYVVVNDEDMFPSGTLELLSLKSVGDSSIDDVIMDAAALVMAAGGPVADVFDRMIEGRSNSLKSVSGIIYTDNIGISGSVGFDTISVGNRKMIEKCGDINLPDIEIERKMQRNNCFAVYIARNDVLCGMLVVKYNEKDSDLTEQLQRLVANGISIFVKTSDPNITSELVCSTFSLDKDAVKIMPAHSVSAYDEVCVARESGDSCLAHQNSLAGYAAALTAAKRLKFNVVLSIVLQTIGTIIGAAIAIYIILSNGYDAVLPTTMLVYQLVCAIITIVVPSFRKV